MAVVASSIQWPTVQEEVKRLLAIHGTMVMEVGSFRRLTGAHHLLTTRLPQENEQRRNLVKEQLAVGVKVPRP